MNRQVLLWTMFFLPWLTVLFMNKRELKRFMPAALFTAFSSGVILQAGYALKLWYFREAGFSVVMYGLLPIFALWIIRFTYGRFWLYSGVNFVLDLGFAFVIIPWFGSRGVFGVGPWTSIFVFSINIVHAALIYGYQKWQEGPVEG